jgi:hypothetical protein
MKTTMRIFKMQGSDRMNDDKKAVKWNHWENGDPMNVIAQTINKPPATIFSYLRYHGGIKPRQRIRSERCLTVEEREEISRGLAMELSIRAIAARLRRNPSSISREIGRNCGRYRYRAADADKAA